jgi:nucleoside-diphosphate-sugar epimerase
MHALVTGAGGFLGRYIVEALLARGDRVRGLARSDYPELAALGVEMVRADIRDKKAVWKACEGVDCVIHTAALAGIGMHWREFWDTNMVGTEHVLTGCRNAGVDRLVFTSSPSVVYAGKDQCGINESAPYQFKWQEEQKYNYSLSKALAEMLVLGYHGTYEDFETGKVGEIKLRSCALRPHLVWGPRDNHLIPRLIARAKSGKLRRVGKGTNLIDISYVENVADAHLLAADSLADVNSPLVGKAYFLSQGEPVNCWQWIDEVLSLAGLPPVKKSIPASVAYAIGAAYEKAYRFFELRGEPRMTRFLAAQLSTSHWFDISAARRDFGYEPRVSTGEGMQRLGAWLQAQNR